MVVSLNIHNHLSSSSDTACKHLLAFNLELQLHHQSRSAYEQTQVSVLDSSCHGGSGGSRIFLRQGPQWGHNLQRGAEYNAIFLDYFVTWH